jgi:hypothetical protein
MEKTGVKAMKVHILVTVLGMFVVEPYTTIQAGETGEVVFVDKDTKETVIKLHRDHPGLPDVWHNTISLLPPYTDHWLERLHFERRQFDRSIRSEEAVPARASAERTRNTS